MGESVTVSVCIPAYNRPRELEETIVNVLPQLEAGDELFISDDGSGPEVEATVTRLAAEIGRGLIRYSRSPQNIGHSANIDRSVRLANGDFALLVSDDDALEPGAIQVLKHWLRKLTPEAAAVVLCPTPYDRTLSEPLRALEPIDMDAGSTYASGRDFVKARGAFFPALISGYAVNRRLWCTAPTSLFHSGICIQTAVAMWISAGRPVAFPDRQLVKYRIENGNVSFSRDKLYPFAFHLDFLRIAASLGEAYGPSLCRILRNRALRSVAYNLWMGFRRGDSADRSLLRRELLRLTKLTDVLALPCLIAAALPHRKRSGPLP